MCDLVFYDSFFTDVMSNLTRGYSNLSPGTQFFLDHASLMRKAPFGASFAPSTAASHFHYHSSKFYEEIDELWNKSIFHFGFLNIHREFSERDAFAETLATLRAIYAHTQRINVHSLPSYMVLGASIEKRSMNAATQLMSTIFIPSLFVAIGHISYSDATFPNCRILPPTVWTFPRGVNRSTDFPLWPHLQVFKVDPTLPLALSLTLAGRYYKPRFSDPRSPIDEEFKLFKPCQDFNSSHYGDPASVCDTKYHYVMMDYNLAVYDTDYDASSLGCPMFGLSFGAFHRLDHARRLQQYLKTQYNRQDKVFTCRSVS
ncbi:hypothetical protein MRX96_008712 [Rhipicephalus microplus]